MLKNNLNDGNWALNRRYARVFMRTV